MAINFKYACSTSVIPAIRFVLEDKCLSTHEPTLESVPVYNTSGYYHSAMDPVLDAAVKP
jgi:hypothetical protein